MSTSRTCRRSDGRKNQFQRLRRSASGRNWGRLSWNSTAAKAPRTVANFLHYVHEGLYADGLFHRTVTLGNQPTDDVRIQVIQAQADPGRQAEFPDPIPLERTSETNHSTPELGPSRWLVIRNPIRGETISSSASEISQNWTSAENATNRGQGFAAFGKVVEGMDVVRHIHASAAEGQTLKPGIRIQRAIRLN